MALALFDLDNTLLDADSDFLWGEFLCQVGAVDPQDYRAANARYYREYLEGRLVFAEYVRFCLGVLARHEPSALFAWRERFLEELVRPHITAEARALVARHRAAGDELAIVTASNAFITAPIAAELGVPRLIATEAATDSAGRFTGEPLGVPSFREGKVQRVKAWLSEVHGERADASLAAAWFYSDSHNDLPLLERVGRPVAVNPDPVLARIARERGWPVMALRAPGWEARQSARLASLDSALAEVAAASAPTAQSA